MRLENEWVKQLLWERNDFVCLCKYLNGSLYFVSFHFLFLSLSHSPCFYFSRDRPNTQDTKDNQTMCRSIQIAFDMNTNNRKLNEVLLNFTLSTAIFSIVISIFVSFCTITSKINSYVFDLINIHNLKVMLWVLKKKFFSISNSFCSFHCSFPHHIILRDLFEFIHDCIGKEIALEKWRKFSIVLKSSRITTPSGIAFKATDCWNKSPKKKLYYYIRWKNRGQSQVFEEEKNEKEAKYWHILSLHSTHYLRWIYIKNCFFYKKYQTKHVKL